MKIFKMFRGFFLEWSRRSKIMQNRIFHVNFWSMTLRLRELTSDYSKNPPVSLLALVKFFVTVCCSIFLGVQYI